LKKNIILVSLVLVVGLAAYLYHAATTIQETDYEPPADQYQDLLKDDRLEDKRPVPFDAKLVYPLTIPFQGHDWQINLSSAVIGLDAPMLLPDEDQKLMELHPSYADAFRAVRDRGQVIPSVSVISGKAKQVDDGLYAALDQAYYSGYGKTLASHVELIKALYDRAGRDHVAAPFLAAGLSLAGVEVDVADNGKKQQLISEFKKADPEPLGFYTWNPTLRRVWDFMRFFQKPFGENDEVPQSLAKLLANDDKLRKDYKKAVQFYYKLTNPSDTANLNDLIDAGDSGSNRSGRPVAVFPPSSSNEVRLFNRLFPMGIPDNVDFMQEMVRRIRSGEVELKPGPDSGWYDYQTYALETLLRPEVAQEGDKLVLSKLYKERLIGAFKALLAKHRETHIREAEGASTAPAPPPAIAPTLRIEPCPTVYLRYARAYAFLQNFLQTTVGNEALNDLHGLKQDGRRTLSLSSELDYMTNLFYGLYLIAAQDIGMKPSLLPDEPVDQSKSLKLANEWLAKAFEDPDLAVDTRIIVPVSSGRLGRHWATLGVRIAKLRAWFELDPQMRMATSSPSETAEWTTPRDFKAAEYLIPVDEFSEVARSEPLTREDFRAICNRGKTKDAIVRMLDQR